MRRSVLLAFGLFVAAAVAAAGDAALPGNHPLTQAQAGALLVAELRCAACHPGIASDPRFEKTAPDLARVGTRVAPAYLRRFLAAPSGAHPGTTMPDVLASYSDSEREAIAEALTHFLVARAPSAAPLGPSEPGDRQVGKLLYHTVGCVACHGPKELPDGGPSDQAADEEEEDEDDEESVREPIAPVAVPLGHVAEKYSVRSLGEFLFQPLEVRRSGRMPDMKLTPEEARAIAAYVVGDAPEPQAFVPEPRLVALGEKHFREQNCAACHTLPGIEPAPRGPSLAEADLTRGCLSSASGRGPRFRLPEAQVQAITASLRAKAAADSDSVVVAKTMTAFRCIACHVRDDYGGVPDHSNAFFTGSDPNLGDDGRIPPPLSLVGAKLQPAWMKKVLFDGESIRPYMTTRMPQYGLANLGHLPAIVARLDVLDGDTDKQIAAIWYYLSLGTSAADPPGLRPVDTKITVGDHANTYRGRSKVAGFRGIAVGLPERISYAFNAETGTLSALWQGDFIGVNWSGQGSGDFQPRGTPITFPQDVSFAVLSDAKAPWPTMPVMTKEAPANADPLYPKNVGYQFRGYFLGERSIPTFQYRIGTVDVEDRSVADGAAEHRELKRVLKLRSPSTHTVWFRALTGDVRRESEQVFVSASIRLMLPAVETVLRPLAGDSGPSELLVRLNLPQGDSLLEVTYEPLTK